MQHGGCKVRQMNPKGGQWHASPDVGSKNLIGQSPGSNSLVRKLLLLIYKSASIDK